MTGVVHLLSASIVSSLALRPSTVYVVRVENLQTRRSWHLRRCFSEFCELRDQLVAAAATLDGAIPAWSSSSTASTSSSSSIIDTASDDGLGDRAAARFSAFPTHRIFWSRSDKAIKRRATALDAFLTEALAFAREVRAQKQIAVFFSVMTRLEAFFECSKHEQGGDMMCLPTPQAITPPQPLPTVPCEHSTLMKYPVESARREHGRWHCAAERWRDADSDSSSDSVQSDWEAKTGDTESKAEEDVDEELLVVGLNKATLSPRPSQRPCKYEWTSQGSSNSEDADRGAAVSPRLRKAASAVLPRETREIRLHYTGSHYAALQSLPPDSTLEGGSVSASAAWAARIEIAGIRAIAKRDSSLRVATRTTRTARAKPRRQLKRTSKLVFALGGQDDGESETRGVEAPQPKKNANRLHLPFTRMIRADRRPECA